MPVELPHLTMGNATVRDYIYFTGGMVGIQFVEGWGLVPTREAGRPHAIGPLELPQLLRIADEADCRLLGFNQMTKTGGAMPFESWRPAVASLTRMGTAADTWYLVSKRAQECGNAVFAETALRLANTLCAIGIELRELANIHLAQLKWALKGFVKPGHFFRNDAIREMQLGLHALQIEIQAAKHSLSTIMSVFPVSNSSVGLQEKTRINADENNGDSTEEFLQSSYLNFQLYDEFQKLYLDLDFSWTSPETVGLILRDKITSFGTVLTIHLCRNEYATTNTVEDPVVDCLDLYNSIENFSIQLSRSINYTDAPA